MLMTWMGHRDLETTMQYTHLARAHYRPTPQLIIDAGASENDPERRILAMLAARRDLRGKSAAKNRDEIAKAG
jgi:hypothetical protein